MVQTTTTCPWDNWYFFVKKIWTLQFLSYIDILYTIRSQIECTFRISRFQTHWGNHFWEKIERSRKKALFFAKDKCAPLKSPEEITGLDISMKPQSFLISSLYPTGEMDPLRSMLFITKKSLWRLSEKMRNSQKWEKNAVFWKNCEIIVIIGHLDHC